MDTTSLIGRRYGRLVVVEYSHAIKSRSWQYYWKCQCDCGNVSIVDRHNLINGSSRSCGCLRNEINIARIKEQKRKKDGQTGKNSK